MLLSVLSFLSSVTKPIFTGAPLAGSFVPSGFAARTVAWLLVALNPTSTAAEHRAATSTLKRGNPYLLTLSLPHEGASPMASRPLGTVVERVTKGRSGHAGAEKSR